MKRKGNIYQTIYSKENLIQADKNARNGKKDRYGIILFDKDREANFQMLQLALINKTYKTSKYTTFPITDPKPRIVYRLPYIDRVLQHAAMIPLKDMFNKVSIAHTYSCIEGRGVAKAFDDIKKALLDVPGTKYCLKLDIKKFYPNIDHCILKRQLRRKIKCRDSLWLLDGIIDSAPGLPIGNFLSQYLANFNLTPFDHWIKEEMEVTNYFRYMDDMIILSGSKEYLHQLLVKIKQYLKDNLNLEVKGNYQIFPVAARGIDVLGYVFYHGYIRWRKRNKKAMARAMAKGANSPTIAAYYGLAKHANCNHLLKKLIPNDKLQRLRHKGGKGIHRRQNKHRQVIEHTDSGT